MSISSPLKFSKLKFDLIEGIFLYQVESLQFGKGVLLSFLIECFISSQTSPVC